MINSPSDWPCRLHSNTIQLVGCKLVPLAHLSVHVREACGSANWRVGVRRLVLAICWSSRPQVDPHPARPDQVGARRPPPFRGRYDRGAASPRSYAIALLRTGIVFRRGDACVALHPPPHPERGRGNASPLRITKCRATSACIPVDGWLPNRPDISDSCRIGGESLPLSTPFPPDLDFFH